ncbi:sacsin-like [Hyperolius riggenbachi]|uniref:sacsin-like n=1 Tax=Hyperolius riggenbachi TaxID=752182 RepID=UPI0035A26BDB
MDFFQRAPPFLIQLQNILRKYPDGGQILKELIQNADDAKASEVIFIYDEREYGKDSLYSKKLQVVQGPALLAYNNEVFSDQDWDGIQRPGNSIKRKDPDTVGRFGLGFNSVYHITDYPAIFSGNNFGFLDPQEEILHRGGRLWNLEKDGREIEELSDQFQPFQKALESLDVGSWEEIRHSGHFRGTLFRFPLRLDPSEISENIYNSERVQELFESFIKDASISLLFLRHVTRVSLKKIDKEGVLTPLLSTVVSIEETHESTTAGLDVKTHLKVTTLTRCGSEEEESKWLVTSCAVQDDLFPDLTELSIKLCNKPSLDLAYPLSETNMDLYGGRLSCILPLPDKEENRTGLPLVINGCFDLTDDRRSLKWLEVDQQHDEAAKWNHILVEQVLPLLYTHAVRNVVALVKLSKIPAEVAQSIWPDPEKTQHKHKWHTLVKKIAMNLVKERVFQTADQSYWITAKEAIFLVSEHEDHHAGLEELLLLLKVPLVKVPRHVYSTLQLASKPNPVSPHLVRQKLRNSNMWHPFSQEKKQSILKYIISDGQYTELLNLQLVPLADGSFTSFQNAEDSMIYIDSEDFPRVLLPGLAHRFIPEDLPADLRLFFTDLGKAKTFKNLVCLNEDVVCRRLREALPGSWLLCPDKVTWCPQNRDHPPLQWITALWTFLQRYPTLDSFEQQPIVPLNLVAKSSSEIQLARLKKKTTLLLQNCDRHSLADCISAILEKAGCTVLRQKNSWLWHKNLDLYLLAPTSNNILKAFTHLDVNQISKVLMEAPEEHIKLLCEVLSQAYSFTPSELDILHKLPIFCSAPSIAATNPKQVAARGLDAIQKDTVPAVPHDLILPNIVIKCRDESDRRLLQQMQIRLLNAADVALMIVTAIQNKKHAALPNKAESAMLWILRNGHVLFTQSGQLKNLCRDLNFIPSNGHFTQPCALFDPKIDILKELLALEKFPPSDYHEDSVLASLKQLGLKGSIEDLTPDEVLQIAETVSQNGSRHSAAKAKALIKVCNETSVLSRFPPHSLQKLCNLPWVPAKNYNSQLVFSQPVNVRTVVYRDIVEFSMALTSDFSEKSNATLGLSKQPPPTKIIEHLKVLCKQYTNGAKENSFERKLQKVYEYIQDNLSQFHDDLLSEVLIWNGNGFSSPPEIVMFYPDGLDLSSFAKRVPSAYLVYQPLFTRCGVKKTLSNQEVVDVLYKLKERLQAVSSGPGTYKDLKLAVLILDWMKANSVDGTDDLPIPVQSRSHGFALEPLSKTLFCDIDKQNLSSTFANDMDCSIVHEEVSVATARFLKVQLLSTKVLKPEFFEPWGPSEPVTLRIKNILREYSELAEIFKELIQNSEDADATECKFLVDMRQNLNNRQTLIDPGMASCHGPALWSYNNSTFTQKDFINITQIGAATKETQAHKIGKFGLGFNTVYHITDVPAILSRSTILVFDPNVNHLQKHIPSNNPGMKLDLQKNSKPLHAFPDQFQPFLGVFGCEFEQPFFFDGTLIRLPFRTEKEANDSKICHQAFSEEQIYTLMNDFEAFADTLLIFLKHVREVELNVLSDGCDPKEQIIKVHVQKEIVQTLAVPLEVSLQKEQIQTSKKLETPLQILDFTTSNIIKLTEQITAIESKYYLTQSSLGVNESYQMFVEDKNIFSLPVAGIALPLKKSPNNEKWTPALEEFQGMVFCYLPLPVSSGLPFHINGTFAVMSNRKNLWDTTVKGDWNKKLLCDALLVAMITALTQLQSLYQKGDLQDYDYYTFWPDTTKVNTFYAVVVKSFYHAVTFGLRNSLPALFSNGQEWCTVKHACFLDLEDIQDETIQRLSKRVFSSLLKKPYMAVSLPKWVRKSFSASSCFSELEKNFYNSERFYEEIIFKQLEDISVEDRNKLVLHAIDLQNKCLDQLLMSKPCIPSSNGRMQFIGKLVHPKGKVSLLFDPEEGRFPEGAEFLKPQRLVRLQTLGMQKDSLPIPELLERASKIEGVWRIDRAKALNQIGCILELLNDLLQQGLDTVHHGLFREILFLPAIPPQSKDVQSRDVTLMKSNGLYHYKHKTLVCMVEPVLSKEHLGKIKLSDELLSFLGLDHFPLFKTVLSQLQEVFKVPNRFKPEETFEIAKYCYKYFNEQIKKDSNYTSQLKEEFSTVPFIYVDGEFVLPKVVAHQVQFHAFPYLHKLPKDYEKFDTLWTCVGVKKEFSAHDYISVLKQMATKYRGKPLSEREFHLAIDLIIHTLQKLSGPKLDEPLDAQSIYIPDKQGILRHVDKIFYYDTPWLSFNQDLNFCHDRIPREVVSKLGVKTKIHQTLGKLKISGLSKWVSRFGAKEQLTTRIKNIIKDYSSKKDILKELIQNADDSEATEIHFVLDCRTHPTMRTFGAKWHPLQGPALCIYNNNKFESKDIDGIQQLGIGSKEDRLDKTGKFGLGFNSVYHITDCPSFVTGDTALGVFDPNILFLESSDEVSPGGMFAVNNEFKDTFEDVYNTFLPSKFNLQEGTLFRLPLRMANTVSRSKISNETSSVQDIRSMCEELRQEAENMILFLSNIRKISFSEITTTNHFNEIVSFASRIHCSQEELLSSFQQRLCEFSMKNEFLSKTSPFQIQYNVEIIQSKPNKASQWVVVKQMGTESKSSLANLRTISDKLHQKTVPHGAVAACITHSVKGRAFCTLPLPVETGLPVHVNANFIVDSARRGICQEDGNSPKTEWNTFLLSDVVAPLYSCLLKRLCEVLTQWKEEPLIFKDLVSCKHFLNYYLGFFPAVTKSVPPQWQPLVKKLFLIVFEKKVPVIPIYKEQEVREMSLTIKTVHVDWSSVGKTTITEEPFFHSNVEYESVGSALQKINMHLAYGGSLNFLCKELKSAGVTVQELSPQSLCEFMRHAQLLSYGQVFPAPVSRTLLRDEETCSKLLSYCLKDCSANNVTDLQGVPLLVTADGMLHIFDRNNQKLSSSFHHELFPDRGNLFATYNLFHNYLIEQAFLKSLTIANSESLVKNHLGESHDMTSSKPCPLLSKEKESWLKTLWQFFEDEISKQDKTENRKRQFESIVFLYSNWAILPVQLKEEPRILSFALIKDMFLPSQSDVAKYLLKLGFPKIELHLFSNMRTIITNLKPLLLDTDNVGQILQTLSSRTDLHWKLLDNLELDMFLGWILSRIQKNQKDINNLQRLPLFETHDGRRLCLTGFNQKYVLASRSDLEALKLSEIDTQTIFLKDTPLNYQASRILNIPIIKERELLTEFLIQHLHLLCESQLLAILRLVLELQHLGDLNGCEDHIFSSLRTIKLIRNRQGLLQQASYFYDDAIKLFHTLELEECFIPKTFWEMFKRVKADLRKLLRKLGMKHYLTEDDFIRFATEIQNDAKATCSSESLATKAEELFEYLLSMKLDKLSTSFPSVVGNIAFVNPLKAEEYLLALHPSFTHKVKTITLKGSLLARGLDHCLVWTSMPLIQIDTTNEEKLKFLKNCGVNLEPPVPQVIENVRNICNTTCENKHSKYVRGKVLQSNYSFLQGHMGEIDYSSLKNIPFVLVDDDDLAIPGQIVFNLPNFIVLRPYLYKLPPLLACYSELFQKVGVEAEASLFHFKNVLAMIYEETSDRESLHPNLIKTVIEATDTIFKLLEQQIPKDLQKLRPLYLPATDGKLYESSSLILNNCRSDTGMGELHSIFKFLYPGPDPYKAECLLQVLPEDVRPRLLSDITKESIQILETCTLGEGCFINSALKEQLLSPMFLQGLVCVLRSQSRGNISQEAAEQKCSNIFGKLQIICCFNLLTSLMHGNETLKNTTTRRPVCVVKHEDDCEIYIEHIESLKGRKMVKVLHALSSQINHLIGNILTVSSLKIIEEMLAGDKPEDILEVLKEHNVWNKNLGTKNAFSFPNPGEEIPKEWYDCLDMSILNTFKVDDYVGYMVPEKDEIYLYAVIVEELDVKVFGSCEVPMYRVDIGHDTLIDVSVYDLYQFKRSSNPSTKALVPLTNPQPQDQHFEKWHESSLEKIKQEIDQALSKIWQLPQAERIKAVRRMYLQYHPDKNIGQEEISTEIFKYLQQRVTELETTGKMKPHTGSAHHSSTSRGFSTFWDEWDREASQHRKNRDNFSRRNRGYYDFWGFHSGSRPNPQEAERWLRQAECDLKSAEKDAGCHTEWVFYKVHQAVKKALFAAQYMRSGNIDKNDDLLSLAEKVSTYTSGLQGLYDQVLQMKRSGVDKQKTQYPSCHPPPRIPSGSFSPDNEEEILTLAGNILRRIKTYIHS